MNMSSPTWEGDNTPYQGCPPPHRRTKPPISCPTSGSRSTAKSHSVLLDSNPNTPFHHFHPPDFIVRGKHLAFPGAFLSFANKRGEMKTSSLFFFPDASPHRLTSTQISQIPTPSPHFSPERLHLDYLIFFI